MQFPSMSQNGAEIQHLITALIYKHLVRMLKSPQIYGI